MKKNQLFLISICAIAFPVFAEKNALPGEEFILEEQANSSSIEDAIKTFTPKIKELSGLKHPDIELEAIVTQRLQVSTFVDLKFIVNIAEKKIPLAMTGEAFFDENKRLYKTWFSRSVNITKIPREIKVSLTQEQVVDRIYRALDDGVFGPGFSKSSISAELVLFPTRAENEAASSGTLLFAYKVQLPLPNGSTNNIYIDANDGWRLE